MGNPDPGFVERAHGAEGDGVVAGEQRGEIARAFQEFLHGDVAAFGADVSVGDERWIKCATRFGECFLVAGPTLDDDVKDLGGECEVGDAPMAEIDQMPCRDVGGFFVAVAGAAAEEGFDSITRNDDRKTLLG